MLFKYYNILEVIKKGINDILLDLDHKRFQKFQETYKDKLKNHFYIIVMQNKLYLLEPCLRLMPKDVNVFLILNGTMGWETKYIRDNYSEYPLFKLTSRFVINHGQIIKFLLKNNKSNFGLIDHDFYIFDKTIFNNLDFKKNEFLICLKNQSYINKILNIKFPKTRFIFFNVNLIKKIIKQYNINTEKNYSILECYLNKKKQKSNLLKTKLIKHFANLDYFEILCFISLYNNLSVKYLDIKRGKYLYITYLPDVFNPNKSLTGFFSFYIHTKILEKSRRLFKDKYKNLFTHYNPEELLRIPHRHLKNQFELRLINKYIGKIDKSIEKIFK